MIDIERVHELIGTVHGRLGVYIACPETGESFSHNAEEPMLAASVIKLCVMLEAFRRREEGTLDFNAPVTVRPEDKLPSCGALTYLHDGLTVTVGDLVTLMIILSDNTATNLLIDLLGEERINRTIRETGLKHTELQRKLFRPDLAAQGLENRVSAEDMGLLMEGLLKGRLISPAASREMLDILLNQRLNGKLPFYLHSRGIRVAHKTGEDDGITNDVGILMTKPPVICCVLANEVDVPSAERMMQDLAACLVTTGPLAHRAI